MLDAETIEQQRSLLTTYRKTLAILLQQQAIHSSAYTPPATVHGIFEARANIRIIKTSLRESGILVDEHPDDEDSPPQKGQNVESAANRLWSCPKCSANNPPNMKFCLSCGAKLLRICSECETETSLISTGICSKCGYAYELASHRAELKRQRQQLQLEIDTIIQQDEDIRVAMSEEGSFWGLFFTSLLDLTAEGGVIVLVVCFLLFYSPSEYRKLAPIGLGLYIPVIFVISLITHNAISAKRARGKSKLVRLEPLQVRLRIIEDELADINLRQSDE